MLAEDGVRREEVPGDPFRANFAVAEGARLIGGLMDSVCLPFLYRIDRVFAGEIFFSGVPEAFWIFENHL
jgi:hypothetical protein